MSNFGITFPENNIAGVSGEVLNGYNCSEIPLLYHEVKDLEKSGVRIFPKDYNNVLVLGSLMLVAWDALFPTIYLQKIIDQKQESFRTMLDMIEENKIFYFEGTNFHKIQCYTSLQAKNVLLETSHNMIPVIIFICPDSIQKLHITIKKKIFYAENDDFTCEMILELSDGEIYIFAATDTVSSYDWDYKDKYMVLFFRIR